MTCSPSCKAGLTVPRRMLHEINQYHVFTVLRMSRGKVKGFGKKFHLHLQHFSSSTSSSTSPPTHHCGECRMPPASSEQTQCNSYPSISRLSTARIAVYFMKLKHIYAFFPRSFLLPGSSPFNYRQQKWIHGQ